MRHSLHFPLRVDFIHSTTPYLLFCTEMWDTLTYETNEFSKIAQSSMTQHHLPKRDSKYRIPRPGFLSR